MLTRRHFLNGTLAAGLALATQRAQPVGGAAGAEAERRIIVDSQIHMWKANTPDRPWVPGTRPQLPEPMTIERVVPMIDDAGVDRVVIVPPTLEGHARRLRPGGGAPLSGPLRHHGPCRARRSGRGPPPGDLAAAAGRARHPA